MWCQELVKGRSQVREGQAEAVELAIPALLERRCHAQIGADGALGDATTLDLPADEFPAGSRELDCAALVRGGDAELA